MATILTSFQPQNNNIHIALPCSTTACTSITSYTTLTTILTTINQYTSSQSNNHPDINYSVLKNTTLHTTTFPNPHTAVLQTSNSIYTSPTKHPYKHLPHTKNNTSPKTNCNEHHNAFTQWLPSLHLSNHKSIYPYRTPMLKNCLHIHYFLHHPHHHQPVHLFTIQQPP